MRSISWRITTWYVVTVAATLACLFVAGHYLLRNQLVRQLDVLNEAQFKHLVATLGTDYRSLTPSIIDDRIRESTESASALFYIDMHGPMTNRFFRSNNLHGRSIPDIPGKQRYTTDLDPIGTLRVAEFQLPPFEITVATPMAPVAAVMDGYREVFAGLLALALIVSVVIGYGQSQLVLRPVRLIRETANRIRSDNLNERIPVGEVRDEISELAHLLNQTFDRLETSFSEIRRFAAEASHELKTPLSLVRLHGERLLTHDSLEPEQREAIQVQLEELARVNQIIEELLFLSRADARAIPLASSEQSPEVFLASFAQDAGALAEHHGVRFSHAHRGDGSVAFEANRIRQVLLNLLVNALKLTPSEGLVKLRSDLTATMWRIEIEDEGPGLTADQRERMFDRFVRFHVPAHGDKGSGLGLAICRSIVHLHRGRIYAVPAQASTGLCVVIEIPVATGAPEAPAPRDLTQRERTRLRGEI
ncbi:MAG: HAMP domain-containing histidine kinase [Pseudomonadota bacterium]|nr:HAMP domain-containing histidine kinase [Pseudomonadota bacterium]